MKITVSGTPNEGKTTIALLIADALAHAGIDVTVEDPDVEDLGTALCDPLLGVRAAALRAKDGFNVVVNTVQVQEDAAAQLRHQCDLLRAYAHALKLDFSDRQKLVDEWGAEEWEGVQCAAFVRAEGPTGDVVALVEDDGTLKVRWRCADPDDYADEDKFTDVLASEIERATRRRHQLHAE